MKVLLLIIAAITATAQERASGTKAVLFDSGWPSGTSCITRYERDVQGNVNVIECDGNRSMFFAPSVYAAPVDSYKVCWYIPSETNVVNCSPVLDFPQALAVKKVIEKSWIQEVK